jgi:hypothetical protein
MLCLANSEDKNGIIPSLTEEKLFRYASIYDTFHRKQGKGILQKLCDNKMITIDNKNDNTVSVINWKKLQNKSLSGYERIKKHRAKIAHENKKKQHTNDNVNDNVDDNENDNARLDKIRIDKNNNKILVSDKPKLPPIVDKVWKRPEPEKQNSLQKIVFHLEDTLHTKITNWGKQGEAYKLMIRAGYTDEQIVKAITYLATEDTFFRDKGFDLMTVSNQMPLLKAKARGAYGNKTN